MKYVLLALFISFSASAASTEGLSSFLGIQLGAPVPGDPQTPAQSMGGGLPIYSVRVPLSAPYDKFFFDARVNVLPADDVVGLVDAQRAYATEASCSEAQAGLIALVEETSGVKAQIPLRSGHLFAAASAHADIDCVLPAGARHFVLKANATDKLVEQRVKQYFESEAR